MKVLILYATSEGQTRKIAAFLAERFRTHDCDVSLVDIVARPHDLRPGKFDAAILAGRVHAGTFPRSLVGFARQNANVLSAMPSAFVPVSMMAARPDDASRQAAARYERRFMKKTGWTPTAVHRAAGARRYSEQGRIGAWIMRRIDKWAGFPADTSCDHEWTDWQALQEFADRFAGACRVRQGQAAKTLALQS